jgi:hypothetical protein
MNSDELISISRQGLELGRLSVDEATELLHVGFLLPTDQFWTDPSPQPRPLCELEETPSAVSPGWLGRAKASVVTTTGVVLRGAGHVTGKVSRTIRSPLWGAVAAKLLGHYVPRLRELIALRMRATARTTQAALKDEAFLRKLFGAVYDCFPRPLHRFVSDQVFIEYCLKHRRKLLERS